MDVAPPAPTASDRPSPLARNLLLPSDFLTHNDAKGGLRVSHLQLSPQVMRLMVSLRRLLLQDHGVDVELDDDYALEALLDAARDALDRRAEELAYAICEALETDNADGRKLRARLNPRFRAPRHERITGSPGGRIYRGQVVADEAAETADPSETETVHREQAPADGLEESASAREAIEVIYRGQRVVRYA